MKRWLAIATSLTTAALLAACSGDDSTDAGAVDAGTPDTGMTTSTDSGIHPDASTPDTGAEEPDAGTPDTGVELVASGGPCVQDSDCESGVCSDFGRQPYCTERCSSASDCGFSNRSMVCENFREKGNICMFECSTSADCGNDPELGAGICLGGVDMGDDTAEDLCVYLAGDPCTSDADCVDNGEFCTIVGGGMDYVYACYTEGATPGRLRPGEACPDLDFDIECRTTRDCPSNYNCGDDNFCDPLPGIRCASYNCGPNNTCLDVCAADGDCANGQRCEGSRFIVDVGTEDDTSDDRFGEIGWCTAFSGSLTSCTDDTACSGGEACQPFTQLDFQVVSQCRTPESYEVAFEARCGDDPDTIEVEEPSMSCASGLCLFGQCSRLCDAASDCGMGYQCLDVDASQEGTPDYGLCIPGTACNRDADCATGEFCSAIDTNLQYAGVCRPGANGLVSGAQCDPFPTALEADQVECTTTADCSAVGTGNWLCSATAGICVPPNAERCDTLWGCREAGGGRCSSRCAADGDCAGPDFLCAGTRITISNNGTADSADDVVTTVGFCEAAPGSRTACTEESDCTAPDESCVFVGNLDGTGRTVCSRGFSHYTKTVGEDCGIVRGNLELCKTGTCDFDDGRFALNLGTCSEFCSDDNDCPAPLTCQAVQFADENFARSRCRRPGAQ